VNAAGKVKPFFKSQPVPKVQEGPVRTVVADSFSDEVLKSKKDVLIEFYAPWYAASTPTPKHLNIFTVDRCGACKKLAPDYTKLARRMKKDNPDLVVAKMDATANDLHPMFGEIKGYPTIFFVPVTNKEDVIPYQGGELTFKALKVSFNPLKDPYLKFSILNFK
jgi:thiol-disulfide isomerase/thioredoxin